MLSAHGATHVGRVRHVNEDAWLCDVDVWLFVVADGMGGHRAGEIASQLAIDVVKEFLVRARTDEAFTWPFGVDPTRSLEVNVLTTAARLANRRVCKASESHEEYLGMGTTLVAALVAGNQLTFASVGDSRLYSFRGGTLQQLSHDDSWVALLDELQRAGHVTQPTAHPMRNVLTNALGAAEHVEPEVREHALVDGDTLLLCSDGLHARVDDATIGAILAEGGEASDLAQRLVNVALERDGTDNITVVITRYDG